MATLDIRNFDGQKVGDIELDDAVFGVEVKQHLLWEVVKQQLASRRAGTHSTLRRSEVQGGGKKPYRQKGTGQARQGSSRAPNHVGGGKVFSPKPRDYSYDLSKTAKRVALRCALSLRVREGRLIVVESLELPSIKTKRLLGALKLLDAPSALVVDHRENTNLLKSIRNLSASKFLPAEGLNIYDVLNHEALVLTAATAKEIEARLAPRQAAAGAESSS
jgi:large subunit ribosomal protein L4